jgi:hypothetical protein
MDSGTLNATRVNGADVVSLMFTTPWGLLEYRAVEGSPFQRAVFPHRPVRESREGLLCPCCGVLLGSWEELIESQGVCRGDAFSLLQVILSTGDLPSQVPEKPDRQLLLPGMQDFLVPDGDWRVVEWRSS